MDPGRAPAPGSSAVDLRRCAGGGRPAARGGVGGARLRYPGAPRVPLPSPSRRLRDPERRDVHRAGRPRHPPPGALVLAAAPAGLPPAPRRLARAPSARPNAEARETAGARSPPRVIPPGVARRMIAPRTVPSAPHAADDTPIDDRGDSDVDRTRRRCGDPADPRSAHPGAARGGRDHRARGGLWHPLGPRPRLRDARHVPRAGLAAARGALRPHVPAAAVRPLGRAHRRDRRDHPGERGRAEPRARQPRDPARLRVSRPVHRPRPHVRSCLQPGAAERPGRADQLPQHPLQPGLRLRVDVVAGLPSLRRDSETVFEAAQRIVRWHYQWLVVHDFLRRTVGEEMLAAVLASAIRRSAGATGSTRWWVRCRRSSPPRWGSSRSDTSAASASCRRSGPSSGRGSSRWRAPARTRGSSHGASTRAWPTRSRRCRPIGGNRPSLIDRNLTRGARMLLPSGQDVAARMGAEVLTDEELGLPGGGPAPLWFYVLREVVPAQRSRLEALPSRGDRGRLHDARPDRLHRARAGGHGPAEPSAGAGVLTPARPPRRWRMTATASALSSTST